MAARRGEPCDNESLPAPKMLVRTLRPIDVVALAAFQRRAGGTEITAHTWPRVEPESGSLPYLNLVTGSLAHRPGGQRAWVAAGRGRVVGLGAARVPRGAAARARAGGGTPRSIRALHLQPPVRAHARVQDGSHRPVRGTPA